MTSPWILSWVAIMCFATFSFCVSKIIQEAVAQTTLDTQRALLLAHVVEPRSYYLMFLVLVSFIMFSSGVVLTLGAVWRFTH